MAEITASMVKELREITGAGMMECKKALTESNGNIEEAIDILRTRGLAALAKKAGRATNEGAVAAYMSEDAQVGVLIEVNCETDFVGTNATFTSFVSELAGVVGASNPADVAALMAEPVPGRDVTVEGLFGEMVGKLGENMGVARFVRQDCAGTGAVTTYIHSGAKIGVLVTFEFANQATATAEAFRVMARDVAMQVAAADPIAVSRDDFDSAVVAHELSIYRAQAAESGKPEAIQEKMAEGRLQKFYKEQALLEQGFVKDPDRSVSEYVASVAKSIGDDIKVVKFERFVLGATAEAADEE